MGTIAGSGTYTAFKTSTAYTVAPHVLLMQAPLVQQLPPP